MRIKKLLFCLALAGMSACDTDAPRAASTADSPTPADTMPDATPAKPILTLNMADYTWSHRPVLVFADPADSPALAEQLHILQPHEAELKEREMVVIVSAENRLTIDGVPAEGSPQELRQSYGIAADKSFAVLLIGKDTGVKLKRNEPVSAQSLFALIDTMPMRRQEMRSRGD